MEFKTEITTEKVPPETCNLTRGELNHKMMVNNTN